MFDLNNTPTFKQKIFESQSLEERKVSKSVGFHKMHKILLEGSSKDQISMCDNQNGANLNDEDNIEKKIAQNKLLVSMVVHDMRSPCVSIKLGIDQAKKIIKEFT